jgi:hypothetical protein
MTTNRKKSRDIIVSEKKVHLQPLSIYAGAGTLVFTPSIPKLSKKVNTFKF